MITLVNSAQIEAHAQAIALIASLLCAGFASYLILNYRKIYPMASKAVLLVAIGLCFTFMETTRHLVAYGLDPEMLNLAQLAHRALAACFASMTFGLMLILLVMNHERLCRAVRHTFTETTSVIRTSKISQLTKTQQIRIIENYNFDDILNTLNTMSSPRATRLLRTISIAGWSLIVTSACFLAVIEVNNHFR